MKRRNILIIEPDKLLGINYKTALELAGFNARWVMKAQDAIDLMDDNLPDLIILELQLPAHNGIEFLYELRSYPEWSGIPVIIQTLVSAESFSTDENLLTRLGIVAYIYKPQAKLRHLVRTAEHILMQPIRT